MSVPHSAFAETGLPWSEKSQGKTKIFRGQEKVREFPKRSGIFFDVFKVSEMSGNLFMESNALRTKSSQKRKEVEMKRKISMASKKS